MTDYFSKIRPILLYTVLMFCSYVLGDDACNESVGESWAVHTQYEVELDHTISEVWSTFMDMNLWYKEYRYEWDSGIAYDGSSFLEGQVLKVIPISTEDHVVKKQFHYLQEHLRVISEKEILAKLTLGNTEQFDALSALRLASDLDVIDFVQFYHWRFFEIEKGRTNVLVDAYVDFKVRQYPSQATIDAIESNFQRSWNENLENLSSILLRKNI